VRREVLKKSNGEQYPADYTKLTSSIYLAGEAGDSYAQAFVALFFEEGIGIRKNEKEAFAWYKKASNAGNEFDDSIWDESLEIPEGIIEISDGAIKHTCTSITFPKSLT